ncbi:protein TOPLESS [Tanacetum coccineum]|uniref:Protein TOPLESS n=1 Tax=Tanacetum coccineum TaxID=301880 RepID=A0ABQ5FQU7_9ASTR
MGIRWLSTDLSSCIGTSAHKCYSTCCNAEENCKALATAGISSQLWQPSSEILMTNDVADMNPEDSVSYFALSKNDSCVMSASGGKISLFNMMKFQEMQTMTMFIAPPPTATFLAFHPQDNNIIAIGMDDSTIQIYNVHMDERNVLFLD